MAVRAVCKTRRTICIQGTHVATAPHRGAMARAQWRVSASIGQKQQKAPGYRGLTCNGGPSGTRTLDLGIKSPLLYQLS